MSAQCILRPYFLREIPSSELYQTRVQDEFRLIDKFGFTGVFVQVHAILDIARRLCIPHIIRGSAGSSLICFFMGITEIDPILYGLQLARFMNDGRQDLPDIDIDVPYNRREELYEEIAKTWPGMVARISNHVHYGFKVSLREAAKEIVLETMTPNPSLRSPQEKRVLKALQRKTFQLDKLLTEEQAVKAKARAEEKVGTLNHYSKHCGGIVIFEKEGKVPEELRLEGTQDDCLDQIHLNKDETEEAGYIKIDILSNRGLAQLVSAQAEPRGLLDYPTRDAATEKLLSQGLNLGLTFGESRGMRKLFLAMKPRHMDDVAIALALIRPAAATRGRKAEFLQSWKHGAELTTGLERQIIFDDDAISLIQEALGCTPAEADRWRKLFAKQNPAGRIQFRQALYKKGIPRSTQDHLMSELDYLALYSFCKSHAVSYAQLVWALAYEKAHNPHRFWMGALNHCHSEFRKWVHYREAKCSGLHLTREAPPYKLGTKQGTPALLAVHSKGEQLRLPQMFQREDPVKQAFQDMKVCGYWLADEFLPHCGIWPTSQQSLERWFGTKVEQRQTNVRFRGLIATGRVLRRDGLVTLLTIGVANQRYIDLVFPDVDCSSVFAYTAVEGKGLYEKRGLIETIQIETIHGVSLKDLSCKQDSL